MYLTRSCSPISRIMNRGANIVTDPDSRLTDLVEGGSSINVQVSLTDPQAPGSEDVVLTVTSSDPTAATVVPSRLTFTSANATINQAVAVSPEDDSVADGNQDYTITVAVVTAESNDLFDSVPDKTLTGIVTDDEAAASFTLAPGRWCFNLSHPQRRWFNHFHGPPQSGSSGKRHVVDYEQRHQRSDSVCRNAGVLRYHLGRSPDSQCAWC